VLLLSLPRTGSLYYRPRRTGERRRKSIRGCIVGPDLAVLNLVVVRKGDADVPGLTDLESAKPNRLGPKRANNIRKLFVRAAEACCACLSRRLSLVALASALTLVCVPWVCSRCRTWRRRTTCAST
jgi:hypothetical protein